MLSRAFALALLLVAEVAAVAGLHALGGLPWFALPSGDVALWLTTSAPGDVVVALLRLVALGCAYWLAVSTGAYTLALVSRLPAAVRGTRWMTHPAVRRVADRAVAVTMATSLAGGSAPAAFAGVGAGVGDAVPAGARPAATQPAAAEGRASAAGAGPAASTPAALEPGPGHMPAAESDPGTPAGGTPPPRLTPESLPWPDEPAGGAPDEHNPTAPDGHDPGTPDGRDPGIREGHDAGTPEERDDVVTKHDRVHVVESGDHLWSVAAADVAAVSQQDVEALDPDDIAPRWQQIVDANRERLRSGDPNLIHPGERIELPPRGE